MPGKNNKAFILYILMSLVLWQLGVSIRDICIKSNIQIATSNNPVLSFVYLENTGGAFSIFKDHSNLLALFGIAALICIVIYAYKKLKFEDKLKILTLVSLSAGILGNLVERIEKGYVIDFIKLNFVNFAVFNFFDILITTSIFLLAGLIIYEDIKKRTSKCKN